MSKQLMDPLQHKTLPAVLQVEGTLMWNRMNGAGVKSECLGELDIKIGLRAEDSRAVPTAGVAEKVSSSSTVRPPCTGKSSGHAGSGTA
jgi:hypothetical protein